MAELPAGTVTVLFTDLEWSTPLLGAHLEQVAGKRPETGLRECPTVTRPAISETALWGLARG